MPDAKRPRNRHPDLCRWLFLLAAAAVFLFFVGRFYISGKGFTALINFGELHADRYLAEVDPGTTFFTPDSDGYDSQWYAQLAIEPNLKDSRLEKAIDNLPYRARRILFCWTSYAFGLGQPRWVLEAFAVQNIVSWLLLGWLLFRWLPPRDWGNCVRWIAVMFSFGLTFSIRGALVDGPGLLLIAGGVALLETGRPYLAAVVLGISGLGKETCILAGAALAQPPPKHDFRSWTKLALRGLVVGAPLLIWTAYIVHLLGPDGTDAGSRNFALPFVEFWNKGTTSFRELFSDPPVFAYTLSGVLTVISLGTQFLFFALRPRWQDPWWRIGASFAVLMMVLGESVWEGYPSAAARVLLPMLLAFNITVPSGRRWWIVLLLGNISILGAPNFVRLPVGIESPILTGSSALRVNQESEAPFSVQLEGPWYRSEQSLQDSWHWTAGDVALVLNNPQSFPVSATLTFGLNSRTRREVTVEQASACLWRGVSTPRRQDIEIVNVKLAPGESRLWLKSARPAEVSTDSSDQRPLAFRVLDLRLELVERAGAE